MKTYIKIEDPYFVEFIYSLIERIDDFFNRPVIVTPYYGSYSQISGFVITVQGTPPKATILFMLSSNKFITTNSPIKEYTYGDSYISLIGYLKRYEIDKIYKIKFL